MSIIKNDFTASNDNILNRICFILMTDVWSEKTYFGQRKSRFGSCLPLP